MSKVAGITAGSYGNKEHDVHLLLQHYQQKMQLRHFSPPETLHFRKSLVVEDSGSFLHAVVFSILPYLVLQSKLGSSRLVKPECGSFSQLYDGT